MGGNPFGETEIGVADSEIEKEVQGLETAAEEASINDKSKLEEIVYLKETTTVFINLRKK